MAPRSKFIEKVSDAQREEIADMFQRLDQPKDGWVCKDKLAAAMVQACPTPPSVGALSCVVSKMESGSARSGRVCQSDFIEWCAHALVEEARGVRYEEVARGEQAQLLAQTGSTLWDLLVLFRRKQMIKDFVQGGSARIALSEVGFLGKASPLDAQSSQRRRTHHQSSRITTRLSGRQSLERTSASRRGSQADGLHGPHSRRTSQAGGGGPSRRGSQSGAGPQLTRTSQSGVTSLNRMSHSGVTSLNRTSQSGVTSLNRLSQGGQPAARPSQAGVPSIPGLSQAGAAFSQRIAQATGGPLAAIERPSLQPGGLQPPGSPLRGVPDGNLRRKSLLEPSDGSRGTTTARDSSGADPTLDTLAHRHSGGLEDVDTLDTLDFLGDAGLAARDAFLQRQQEQQAAGAAGAQPDPRGQQRRMLNDLQQPARTGGTVRYGPDEVRTMLASPPHSPAIQSLSGAQHDLALDDEPSADDHWAEVADAQLPLPTLDLSPRILWPEAAGTGDGAGAGAYQADPVAPAQDVTPFRGGSLGSLAVRPTSMLSLQIVNPAGMEDVLSESTVEEVAQWSVPLTHGPHHQHVTLQLTQPNTPTHQPYSHHHHGQLSVTPSHHHRHTASPSPAALNPFCTQQSSTTSHPAHRHHHAMTAQGSAGQAVGRPGSGLRSPDNGPSPSPTPAVHPYHALATVTAAVQQGEAPLMRAALSHASRVGSACMADPETLKDLGISRYFQGPSKGRPGSPATGSGRPGSPAGGQGGGVGGGLAAAASPLRGGAGRPGARSPAFMTSPGSPHSWQQRPGSPALQGTAGVYGFCPSPASERLMLQLPSPLKYHPLSPAGSQPSRAAAAGPAASPNHTTYQVQSQDRGREGSDGDWTAGSAATIPSLHLPTSNVGQGGECNRDGAGSAQQSPRLLPDPRLATPAAEQPMRAVEAPHGAALPSPGVGVVPGPAKGSSSRFAGLLVEVGSAVVGAQHDMSPGGWAWHPDQPHSAGRKSTTHAQEELEGVMGKHGGVPRAYTPSPAVMLDVAGPVEEDPLLSRLPNWIKRELAAPARARPGPHSGDLQADTAGQDQRQQHWQQPPQPQLQEDQGQGPWLAAVGLDADSTQQRRQQQQPWEQQQPQQEQQQWEQQDQQQWKRLQPQQQQDQQQWEQQEQQDDGPGLTQGGELDAYDMEVATMMGVLPHVTDNIASPHHHHHHHASNSTRAATCSPSLRTQRHPPSSPGAPLSPSGLQRPRTVWTPDYVFASRKAASPGPNGKQQANWRQGAQSPTTGLTAAGRLASARERKVVPVRLNQSAMLCMHVAHGTQDAPQVVVAGGTCYPDVPPLSSASPKRSTRSRGKFFDGIF